MKEAFWITHLVLVKNVANHFWVQLLAHVRRFHEVLPIALLEKGGDFFGGVLIALFCGLGGAKGVRFGLNNKSYWFCFSSSRSSISDRQCAEVSL